jgi:hypothetical protein
MSVSRFLLAGCGIGAIAVLSLLSTNPAAAFCVRNDIGAPIQVEALDGTATFATELANNKKTCCQPKDTACAIEGKKVKLSITSMEGDSACTLDVDAKGNVNVTGKPDAMKCKANKAGSTMDWASG